MDKRVNIDRLKQLYPKGTRVELISMEGELQMPPGLQGSVDFLDGAGQIHVKWDNGSGLALVPEADKFKVVNQSLAQDKPNFNSAASKEWLDSLDTVKVYFPLDVKLRDEDNLESYDDNDYWCDDITSAEAVGYADEIIAQIEKENRQLESPRGLMEYFNRDDTVSQKVYSMFPAVEEYEGELWGVMIMKVDGTLSPAEIGSLKDYACGQNSDGYGESLEQHAIKVDRGELYVSLWSSGRDYKLYTQDEFSENNQAQGMGGAGAMDELQAAGQREKPDCPIVGADGNIFSVMGIAARTLKENGMKDEAKEMRDRVTSSGSYTEALAIIMDYVNPVAEEDMDQGLGMSMGGMSQ